MERFEKLVKAEVKKLLADEPEKQARAMKLAKKVFEWLDEGGVDRIEEGLKKEVSSTEKAFAGQEEKIARGFEEK